MRSALRYCLALTACALLALPPGWCCILAPAPADRAAPAEKPARGDCCRGCCPQPTPDDDAPPGREPMRVCCQDNLIPSHKGPAKQLPDAVAAAMPFAAQAPARLVMRAVAASRAFPSPRDLHVLLCVWLC